MSFGWAAHTAREAGNRWSIGFFDRGFQDQLLQFVCTFFQSPGRSGRSVAAASIGLVIFFVIKINADVLVLKAQFFRYHHCVCFQAVVADDGALGRKVHNAVPELEFGVVSCNGMTWTLLVSETCAVHPAVRKLLCSGAVPPPVHQFLRGYETGLVTRDRAGVFLRFRSMQIQGGYINRILAQLFRDLINAHHQGIPVHGIMLAAEVHLPAVAVHNVHTLFDVQAPGSQVRAIRLVHRSAENGAAANTGIGD